jgi:hypothetical protein
VNLPINKLPIDQLFLLIDFLGLFVGALGGALARRIFSSAFCDWLGFNREISTVMGASGGFGLRLLALRFHWQTRAVGSEP